MPAHKAQLLEGERLALALAGYGVPVELVRAETLAEVAAVVAAWPAAA